MKRKYWKAVCWGNAILTLPYFIGALYGRTLRSEEISGFPLLDFAFIAFTGFLIYGLARLRPWSKWPILADSLGSLVLVGLFPVAGAYLMMMHPALYLYAIIFETFDSGGFALMAALSLGKIAISIFNIFYFFKSK